MVYDPEVCFVLQHWPWCTPIQLPPLQPLLAAQAGAQGIHWEFTYCLSKLILHQWLLAASSGFLSWVFSQCSALNQTIVHVHRVPGLRSSAVPINYSRAAARGGADSVLPLCCSRCEANALKSAIDFHFLFKLRANNLDRERKTETSYLLFSGEKRLVEKALWTTGISVWILF